jgi:hypothetical protein
MSIGDFPARSCVRMCLVFHGRNCSDLFISGGVIGFGLYDLRYSLIDKSYLSPSLKLTCTSLTHWFGLFEIYNILNSLRPTAAGPDGIPEWFLRLGAQFLAQRLSTLFNLEPSTFITS